MKRNIVLFVLVFVLLIPIQLFALTGKVIQVKDGDTVLIAHAEGGQFFICRLYGIDTPEIQHGKKPGQSYGDEAMKELKQLILGQVVDVELTGTKTSNREVCIIKKNGIDVNLEMVKLGYAWAYKQYLKRPYASEYIDAENEARNKKLGLWKQANPQPPWEFRKSLRGR
ncbi:MAG: thermonuclease family protein [Thermodesulfovibrionales bacterium]|nr:thermonuclease family protein [Thermodesulfovibrionales bacterium]